MARERSPDRDKAFEIYQQHQGNITNREIAKLLDIPEKTISVWKLRDKWKEGIDCSTSKTDCSTTKRRQGGQPGNRNAQGHGAPAKNKNAETHGFFSKYLPEETLAIMEEIQQKHPLDILWENITIQYTAIVRAQRIMYVTGKDEMIKELKDAEYLSLPDPDNPGGVKLVPVKEAYNFQFAWDRQATFLQAQSRAMATLQSMIKQYDELLKSGMATEEQKLRVEKLKVEIDKAKGFGGEEGKDDGFIEALKAGAKNVWADEL